METEEKNCRACVESAELGDGSLICVKRSKKGKIFYIQNPGRVACNCGEYFDEQGFEELIETIDDVSEVGAEVLDDWDEEFDGEEVEFNLD